MPHHPAPPFYPSGVPRRSPCPAGRRDRDCRRAARDRRRSRRRERHPRDARRPDRPPRRRTRRPGGRDGRSTAKGLTVYPGFFDCLLDDSALKQGETPRQASKAPRPTRPTPAPATMWHEQSEGYLHADVKAATASRPEGRFLLGLASRKGITTVLVSRPEAGIHRGDGGALRPLRHVPTVIVARRRRGVHLPERRAASAAREVEDMAGAQATTRPATGRRPPRLRLSRHPLRHHRPHPPDALRRQGLRRRGQAEGRSQPTRGYARW